MKKTLALILTIAMAVALFTGCTGTTVVIGECTCPCVTEEPTVAPETTPVEPSPAPVIPENEAAATGALKTGLAVSTNIADTVSATAEANGAAKYDVTLAAVTVDDNGVIQSCVIDSIPATVEFDTTGAIVTDLTAPVSTKNELGENYGMVAWAGAIAEWNEQAASFAQYITGKTAADVAGIAITDTTKPADGSDLASSVTIAIGGFQALIAKAMQ